MKRPALQNKRVAVLDMALRARKVFGTFEKRAPGPDGLPNVVLKEFAYELGPVIRTCIMLHFGKAFFRPC